MQFINFDNMKKSKVIETLEQFPNEFSMEELLEKLLSIDKIERGMADSEEGRTISLNEVKSRMRSKWSK